MRCVKLHRRYKELEGRVTHLSICVAELIQEEMYARKRLEDHINELEQCFIVIEQNGYRNSPDTKEL